MLGCVGSGVEMPLPVGVGFVLVGGDVVVFGGVLGVPGTLTQ
jgi:hypothetical protein